MEISDYVPSAITSLVASRSSDFVAMLALLSFGSLSYMLIKFSYLYGYMSASMHGSWMALLFFASFGTGVVASGIAGYSEAGPILGVLIGISPVVGLFIGAKITVMSGFGNFDSSPLVLGVILVAPTAIVAFLAWILGRTAGL